MPPQEITQNDDTPEALKRRRLRAKTTTESRPRNRIRDFSVLTAGLSTIIATVPLADLISIWFYRLIASLALFFTWFVVIYALGKLGARLIRRQ